MSNPNIDTENINEDGEITDGASLGIAAYYNRLVSIAMADGYLRVVSEEEAFNVETRIPFEMLEKMGFTLPEATQPAP